jgi:hypothetical protein
MKFAAIAALLSCAGLAQAQFIAGPFAGPINSDGPVGSPNNGVVTATYTGANALFGSLNVSGTLTEVNTGTFASEARWNIRNTAFAGGGVNVQPFTQGGFTGSVVANATFSNLLVWANTGDNFRFEAFESLNDSGIDAAWTNTTFTFRDAPNITPLGNYNEGAFDLNTFTSNFDTEIALYSTTGTLIATNDDAGTGLQSQITPTLAIGTYYVVVGGFNSGFADGLAVPGAEAGNFVLNINGGVAASGTLAAFTFAAYSINVIPAPGAAALAAMGLLVAGRRRR